MKGEIRITDEVNESEAASAGAALAERRWKKHERAKKYRALQHIWHTANGRYYEPGDTVDLSHLSDEAIAALIESGVVEVKDGILGKESQD